MSWITAPHCWTRHRENDKPAFSFNLRVTVISTWIFRLHCLQYTIEFSFTKQTHYKLLNSVAINFIAKSLIENAIAYFDCVNSWYTLLKKKNKDYTE